MTEKFDVIIVGAGISGISAAWHLQKKCPSKSYVILEGRKAIGGTWDLFRYPGIRSDSDMHTMGFSFKPWTEPKSISDGERIRNYICETAIENNIAEHIRYQHKLISACWSSENFVWTLTAQKGDRKVTLQCNFLHMCNGYYNYDKGYLPDFLGYDDFKGELIHPQLWPEKLDYAGKRVIIVGSGATAITLLPSMAQTAAHVTMLQRSPTYMIANPSTDPISAFLRRFLPEICSYRLTRIKNILLQILFFQIAKRRPEWVKTHILNMIRDELGDDFDIEKHFTPSYNPWDQRMCLVPDSDFFDALKNGSASVVTEHIERFTEQGIALKSGEHLNADIIVTATGLNMQILQNIDFSVDREQVVVHDCITYKGAMLSDVPNLAFTMGYFNASWTLKADLTASWVCRLLNFMEKKGYSKCVPVLKDASVTAKSVMHLNSGYFQRALDHVPKQGSVAPWKLCHNYVFDCIILSLDSLADGVMEFSSKPKKQEKADRNLVKVA